MSSVVDASSVVAYLLGDGTDDERRAFAGATHAPTLLGVEVTHALRGLLRAGRVGGGRAEIARADLARSGIRRHPDDRLLARAWELRDRCSTHDALYVALAERLGATLVTRDARLARGVSGLVAVCTPDDA